MTTDVTSDIILTKEDGMELTILTKTDQRYDQHKTQFKRSTGTWPNIGSYTSRTPLQIIGNAELLVQRDTKILMYPQSVEAGQDTYDSETT